VYAYGTPLTIVVAIPVCSVAEVVVKLELELVLVVEAPLVVFPLSPVKLIQDVWPSTIEPV
jgi:hypothetical protein